MGHRPAALARGERKTRRRAYEGLAALRLCSTALTSNYSAARRFKSFGKKTSCFLTRTTCPSCQCSSMIPKKRPFWSCVTNIQRASSRISGSRGSSIPHILTHRAAGVHKPFKQLTLRRDFGVCPRQRGKISSTNDKFYRPGWADLYN